MEPEEKAAILIIHLDSKHCHLTAPKITHTAEASVIKAVWESLEDQYGAQSFLTWEFKNRKYLFHSRAVIGFEYIKDI
jgi:hypothetical protein